MVYTTFPVLFIITGETYNGSFSIFINITITIINITVTINAVTINAVTILSLDAALILFLLVFPTLSFITQKGVV